MLKNTDCSDLLSNLNALLASLKLPKRLDCPLALSPTIILDILERMLHSPLPISSEIRQCRTRPGRVQAMKIFLGILADDLLKLDVLLDHIDPRRLADGEEDEIIYVGELLCWLGKELRLIPEHVHIPIAGSSSAPIGESERRSSSPSTRSTMTSVTVTTHSSPSELETTMTSIASIMEYEATTDFDQSVLHDTTIEHDYDSKSRCVHDMDSARQRSWRSISAERSQSQDDSEACCNYVDYENDIFTLPLQDIPVRHTGWIEKVDVEQEIRQFETLKEQFTRSKFPSHMSKTNQRKSSRADMILKSSSASEHTLALLNERARLLAELADIQVRYSSSNYSL